MITASLAAVAPPTSEPPLAYVLLLLVLFACVASWAIAQHVAVSADAAAADSRPIIADDLIYDAALEALAFAEHGDHGRFYRTCPGCALEVHHTDLCVHARECTDLHALMLQRH